jgi:hypothetical protein
MRTERFLALAVALTLAWPELAQASPTPVPLPGSLVMMTTGIVALAGVAWWLRRK